MNSGWRFATFGGMFAAFAAAVAAAPLAVASAAQPLLDMLDRVEPGRWEIRTRGQPGAVERMCLQDGRRLIQLRHPVAGCQQVVVEDGPVEVAVQYTCRGQGYGLTRIRRETPRLLQIDSQGIAQGLPFAFIAEARRLGDCDG